MRVESDPDHRYMLRALELAGRGWGRVAPNPLVGAVLVRDGEVVGEGWHAEYGRAHAEVAALLAAGERAIGATAYVSLEPCAHQGKTPPCTDALIRAGVTRVVYAAPDPDPRARGGGDVLSAAGIHVRGGVAAERARDLNAPFFHRHDPAVTDRPWVELKLALSLDAAIADAAGRSAWITGEAARAEVHRLRAGRDAICVGIGTVLADDPRLTVRGPVEPRMPPVRVVFDRTLRLPPESQLARTAAEVPVVVIADPAVPAEVRRPLQALGVEVVGAPDLASAMRRLRERAIGSLFVEGGAGLAASLLREDLVDRLSLFYAPLLLGSGAVAPFASGVPGSLSESSRWRRIRTAVFDADTLITLARPR